MQFKCPVCGFTTASDATLARHIAGTFNMHEHHLEWMESRGIPVEDYSPFKGLKAQKDFFHLVQTVVAAECLKGAPRSTDATRPQPARATRARPASRKRDTVPSVT
jgi:hypothetical protein